MSHCKDCLGRRVLTSRLYQEIKQPCANSVMWLLECWEFGWGKRTLAQGLNSFSEEKPEMPWAPAEKIRYHFKGSIAKRSVPKSSGAACSAMDGWAAEISKKGKRWLAWLEEGIPRPISCKEETSFSCLPSNRPAGYQIKSVYFQFKRGRRLAFPSEDLKSTPRLR